jgi:hypothetical protein
MRQRLLVWIAIGALILAAYWFCLRYWFPGYYSPVSAFDSDFYDYASLRDKTLTEILRFPRPAAYYAMKVLGLGGLTWVMVDGIAVALANIWLTIFLVRQVSRCSLIALPLAAALYSFLIFAHPDFYFEHRHDLPAEVSYLFAMVSLICWNRYLQKRKLWLVLAAAMAAVLFVFSKETYFLSILCIPLGIAITDRPNWKRHGAYILLLAALEGASLLWNAHLKGPFVNTNAALNDPYRIDVSPGVLAHTTWFYLSHFLNPFLLVLVLWVLFLLRKEGRLLVIAVAFIAAGMAALGPHAILPNHLLEEYAWVGVPLLLAPVLLIGGKLWPLQRETAITALLGVLVLGAPGGYRSHYGTDELKFGMRQDVLGRHLARSVRQLHAIPQGSRVLVAGLDATYIPFFMEGFMLTEFGEHVSWTLLTGPGIPPRRNNRVTHILNVPEAQLDSYDELVTYDSEGELLSIRKVGEIRQSERQRPAELLAPELQPLARLCERFPREAYRKFLAASVCLDWGLWDEAKRYLDGAAAEGSENDPTYGQLSARLADGLRSRTVSPAAAVSLTARPLRMVDEDGTGLGVTELVWTISPPRFCEIRIDAPDGKLFATASTSGSSKTEKWVKNGMTFFLQDVSGGRSLTRENTLAEVTVEVSPH